MPGLRKRGIVPHRRQTIATVTDDGTEDHGDMEWDDDSYAECAACHRHGTAEGFYNRLTIQTRSIDHVS